MNLEWNVFHYNINKEEIDTINIFNHWKFSEDVQKSLKKFKDKDEFSEQLRRDLFYYFCSKCEYEVIITSFPTYITMNELNRLNEERASHKEKYGRDCMRLNVCPDTWNKIDIYTQVMNNWDIFLDYVWNSKKRRNEKAGRGYAKKTGKCPMCEDCPDNCPLDKA